DWTLAASGGARMKLHNTRCHFQEISHRREREVRRDYLKFSFSAFSAFCDELLCFFFDLTGRFFGRRRG
ncbi:MAG: hypothetical protein MUO88_24990, partial [Desulfobacterales bacterium]|nr:hypothetical protein [Desulfobacterales bacterium]